MDEVEENLRVQEAQLSSLDHHQDDAEGNLRAYGAHMDTILTTLDCHKDLLIEAK